jgi:hypothetical protein
MSEQFTIEIPNSQANYMRQLAQLTKQSVEEILAEAIFHPIPPIASIDEQLIQVTHYTNAQLWSIILGGLGFPQEIDERMLVLIERGKQETLSLSGREELDDLMDLYDKYVLLRAKIITELRERGEDIQTYLQENKPA